MDHRPGPRSPTPGQRPLKQRYATRYDKSSLATDAPHQKSTDVELARRQVALLAQFRTGAYLCFGFLQRQVTGSNKLELRWCAG
ncbi:hypothetical protein Q4I28_002444 [Leishmania naiffi]|uniref:Uncharacterized protein n=1 Tax=Leishmania naiffi TaxID=5678 RepID=A0AAW3C003_9TRYP